MHKHKTMRTIGRASCSALCAGALAASMIVAPVGVANADSHPAMDGDQYVSCSPTPFAAAWPEYLGMNTADERWGIDDAADGGAGTLYDNIENRSGALRYLLMGTDEYNVNPDAYMYNVVWDTDGKKTIQNSKRTAYNSTNMNRALGFYGTADSDDAIWNMKPDVIMGVATTSNTTTTDYTAEVADLVAKDPTRFSNYHPVAVNANVSASQVDLFYELADAANEAAKDNGKKLRYGDDATELAKNYEGIWKGSQGYVLSRLKSDGAEKKTVVFVSANDGANVTLTTGFDSNYDKTLENVAVNWADSRAGGGESMTIPISELVSNAGDIDLVVLESDDYNRDGFVATTGLENLYGKMYWVADADCGTVGCDNRGPSLIVNFGRMLGCLYPEYIDQSDWVAYVYDTVFHVKAEKLNDAINRAMDGVRNWDVKSGSGNDYLQWTENTCADYNKSEVKAVIDYGMAFLKAQGSDVDESLQPSSRIAGDIGDFAGMKDPAAKPDQPTTPEPEQPDPTVEGVAMYRLYNPNSGEHFYTSSELERDATVAAGWNYEKIEWYAPEKSSTPVYRLYNPNLPGEHHYTMSAEERDMLVGLGWIFESRDYNADGAAWYSDDAQGTPLYRQYNPNEYANNHNYTTDKGEHDYLIGLGWNDEGLAWYGVAK